MAITKQVYDWQLFVEWNDQQSVTNPTDPFVDNLLPDAVVVHDTVAAFQSSLQERFIKFATAADPDWPHCFSPRLDYHSHPLLTV